MKGNVCRKGVWVLCGGLLLLPQARAIQAPPSQAPPENLPPGALVFRGPNAGKAVDASAGTNNVQAKTVLSAKLLLRPELAEVVRLEASGVSEQSILAHIQDSPPLSPISADELVYLKDLGVPPAILAALLGHQQEPAAASAEDMQGPTAEPQSFAPPTDSGGEPETLPGPPYFNPVDYGYVYSALSPYGAWMDLPGSGWCWQPTVGTLDSTWQPYCNNGRWRWSDSGWYWDSHYKWGWAPFHYGRWSKSSRYGWLWHPGRVWAPAWVSWRDSGNLCGWAPLPPGTDFTLGSGWTRHGRAVDSQQPDFGLAASSFTYVAKDQMLEPAQYRAHSQQATALFERTRPAARNGFRPGANNRILNVGVDPNQVQRATGRPLRASTIRGGFSDQKGFASPALARQGSFQQGGSQRNATQRTEAGTGWSRGQNPTTSSRSSRAGAWAASAWMGGHKGRGAHVPQYPTSAPAAAVVSGQVPPWTPVTSSARTHDKGGWRGGHAAGAGGGSRLVYPFAKPATVVSGGGAGHR